MTVLCCKLLLQRRTSDHSQWAALVVPRCVWGCRALWRLWALTCFSPWQTLLSFPFSSMYSQVQARDWGASAENSVAVGLSVVHSYCLHSCFLSPFPRVFVLPVVGIIFRVVPFLISLVTTFWMSFFFPLNVEHLPNSLWYSTIHLHLHFP